jgi:kinesin family protein 2/24
MISTGSIDQQLPRKVKCSMSCAMVVGGEEGGVKRSGRAAPPLSRGRINNQTTDKPSISDFHNEYVRLIDHARLSAAEELQASGEPRRTGMHDVIEAKSKNSDCGVETSTFTICLRIRPTLPTDPSDGDGLECIFPWPSSAVDTDDYSEACAVFTPKVAYDGKAKLDMEVFELDKTFGPAASNADVHETCKPLIARVVGSGQVGTIIAFGQTGAGKTHTMNALMDQVAADLFDDPVAAASRTVSFSYMEILGQTLSDCLCESQEGPSVQLGELLDGSVVIRNLTERAASSAAELKDMLETAKSRRRSAVTERNAESSRSHGVGILKIGEDFPPGEGPAPGVLYIIDLAGSERAADSRTHDASRMRETRDINLSLMSLKECIRARTLAATPGVESHVPFRRSKLTLLLKDCFDVSCARLCNTLVLAHVSPLARDVAHSLNSAHYAAPLRVALRKPNSALQKDVRDPVLWDYETALAWVNSRVAEVDAPLGATPFDPSSILGPGTSGLTLSQMPELVMYRKVLASFRVSASTAQGIAPDVTESERYPRALAKKLYCELWTLICDAKTRKRRPNGNIVTPEEEAVEQARVEEDVRVRQEEWQAKELALSGPDLHC